MGFHKMKINKIIFGLKIATMYYFKIINYTNEKFIYLFCKN